MADTADVADVAKGANGRRRGSPTRPLKAQPGFILTCSIQHSSGEQEVLNTFS